MRKLTFLLTFFMLLGSVHLQAKEYAIKDIPMVHLQNRTRYVSNPDGILSSTAVTTMDSILYALEQKTGIQTLVVAVTGIEGGDCFDFAHRLGQETGVGQKERDNGLVILLSTDERCVQFATGYGLEGILPDAICKRIQNRYMLPYFKDNNWNAGMPGYIEYKNKTQEKCNYCTIYQCISGFYKKNVELHLLLILAIDSLIYSFYVTILLCKKAPVFD